MDEKEFNSIAELPSHERPAACTVSIDIGPFTKRDKPWKLGLSPDGRTIFYAQEGGVAGQINLERSLTVMPEEKIKDLFEGGQSMFGHQFILRLKEEARRLKEENRT